MIVPERAPKETDGREAVTEIICIMDNNNSGRSSFFVDHDYDNPVIRTYDSARVNAKGA